MFTGIIRHVGVVRTVRPIGAGRRLTIDLGPLAEGLAVGDSLAVCGACLTACRVAAGEADFDAVAETLARTTLGELSPRSKVNLERPLRADDLLHGHIVQGHVDGVAEVRRVDRASEQWTVQLDADRELTDQMVQKGSVALAGVSLTLTAVGEGTFAVALIPTTWRETTLGELAVGSKVNVETDVLGKYVRRYLQQLAADPADRAAGLTLQKLRDAGFA